MAKKTVTSRFKGTDIFQRRIVITVTRSGVLLIVFGLITGGAASGSHMAMGYITIISVVSAIIALITTVEARHQLRCLRYELRDREIALMEGWQLPQDMPDLRESIEAVFDDDEDKDNAKTTFLRLPKSK